MTITATQPEQPGPANVPHGVAESRSLFDGPILRKALVDSFLKLNPAVQVRNPVMFVVLVGTVVTFLEAIAHPSVFAWSITVWLFLTVIFANFAEAMAEGRGKAQADTLRKMRSETEARRLRADGTEELVPAAELNKGDTVVCEANDLIPSDGEIIEGIASVDESAITGESAPVIRESGGDRSAVTGGTRVLSDRDRGSDHGRARSDVPGPHDHSRRGGQPAEDPERDRPHHFAGRPDHHLHTGCCFHSRRSASTRAPRSRLSSWWPCSCASSPRPSEPCCPRSGSWAWTAWCRRTSSP